MTLPAGTVPLQRLNVRCNELSSTLVWDNVCSCEPEVGSGNIATDKREVQRATGNASKTHRKVHFEEGTAPDIKDTGRTIEADEPTKDRPALGRFR